VSLMKKNYVIETVRKGQMISLLTQGKRIDGRSLDQIRPLSVKTGIILKANGSALVNLGDSQVLAGVKIATGVPFPDTPNDGLIVVNAELLPLSSPYAEAGPPSMEAVELARVVDRGVRESQMVDTKALCITPAKLVYTVFVDVNIMNVDGNLFDAASYAVVAALKTSSMPKFKVENDKPVATGERVPLPVSKTPVSVTVARIGDFIVTDPNAEEEAAMDARLTITTEDEGNVCAGQKGEASFFTPEQVLKTVDNSIRIGKEIRKVIQEAAK